MQRTGSSIVVKITSEISQISLQATYTSIAQSLSLIFCVKTET